jgi:hypothetical protein
MAGTWLLLFSACDRYVENPVPTPVAPKTAPVPTKAPFHTKSENPPESKKVVKQVPMTDRVDLRLSDREGRRGPVRYRDRLLQWW